MTMLQYIIITLSILGISSAMANDVGIQKECYRYTYLKSSLNQQAAEKSCGNINNRFALACSKMAVAYLHRENQTNLLASCSKIKTEKALSCVIKKAIQAKSDHAKKISQCS